MWHNAIIEEALYSRHWSVQCSASDISSAAWVIANPFARTGRALRAVRATTQHAQCAHVGRTTDVLTGAARHHEGLADGRGGRTRTDAAARRRTETAVRVRESMLVVSAHVVRGQWPQPRGRDDTSPTLLGPSRRRSGGEAHYHCRRAACAFASLPPRSQKSEGSPPRRVPRFAQCLVRFGRRSPGVSAGFRYMHTGHTHNPFSLLGLRERRATLPKRLDHTTVPPANDGSAVVRGKGERVHAWYKSKAGLGKTGHHLVGSMAFRMR